MSCKNLIYTALTTPTAVLADGAVPLGSIVRRYGSCINASGNEIAIAELGYYAVNANVTVEPDAAGPISATLLVNGTAYPGAVATATAAAAGDAVMLPIAAIVRTFCCADPARITLVLSAAGTVTNAAVAVERG